METLEISKELQDKFREDFVESTLKRAWGSLCNMKMLELEYGAHAARYGALERQVEQIKASLNAIGVLSDAHSVENRGKLRQLNEKKADLEKAMTEMVPLLREASTNLEKEENTAAYHLGLADFAKTFTWEPPKPVEKKEDEPIAEKNENLG